jgi:hypothetical protein
MPDTEYTCMVKVKSQVVPDQEKKTQVILYNYHVPSAAFSRKKGPRQLAAAAAAAALNEQGKFFSLVTPRHVTANGTCQETRRWQSSTRGDRCCTVASRH